MEPGRGTRSGESRGDPVIDSAIRLGLVGLLAAWSLYIAAPFIGPVVWGVVIAVGAHPFYEWLRVRAGLGRMVGAAVLALLIVAVVVVPAVFLAGSLAEEARGLAAYIGQDALRLPPPPARLVELPVLGEPLDAFWRRAAENPGAVLGEFQPQLIAIGKWVLKAAAGVGVGVLTFVFSVVIAMVFLVTAASGREMTLAIFGRLAGPRGEELAELAKQTVRSVVNGILGVAVLQGLLAGLGFMAMGITGAGILAMLVLLLAVVQLPVGLVLLPVSVYGFYAASVPAAVLFLVWNLAIGAMDNVLKPILLARGVNAPMVVIFVGAIGGLVAHGLVGLFVGAVVLVLSYNLFIAWLEEGREGDAPSAPEGRSDAPADHAG